MNACRRQDLGSRAYSLNGDGLTVARRLGCRRSLRNVRAEFLLRRPGGGGGGRKAGTWRMPLQAACLQPVPRPLVANWALASIFRSAEASVQHVHNGIPSTLSIMSFLSAVGVLVREYCGQLGAGPSKCLVIRPALACPLRGASGQWTATIRDRSSTVSQGLDWQVPFFSYFWACFVSC